MSRPGTSPLNGAPGPAGAAAFLVAALACGGGNPAPETLNAGDVAGDRSLVDRFGGAPAQRTLRGKASYYHDSLAGNTTANGDIYDPDAFTAASRDLAFGTLVRVVRIDNGAQVLVRINDRGPFRRKERILDLSRAAAEALDMIRAGVVRIRAEVVYVPE